MGLGFAGHGVDVPATAGEEVPLLELETLPSTKASRKWESPDTFVWRNFLPISYDARKKSMANVGIEPKTFALLARRSNQLS